MDVRIEDDIESDPADYPEALSKFLTFLAADLEAHLERIKAMDNKLQERLQRLIDYADVDLDQALQDDDE